MLDDVGDDESLWSRRFEFDDGSSNDKTTVAIEEEWNAGIGGTAWEGGVLLARFLSSPVFSSLEGLPRGRQLRAIELGCGVSALPCLVAARLTSCSLSTSSTSTSTSPSPSPSSSPPPPPASSSPPRLPLFSEIYATDIDECLPGLEANARKNLQSSCVVEVVTDRPWEEEEQEEEEKQTTTSTTATEEQRPPNDDSSDKRSKTVLKLLDLDWRLFPRAATRHLGAPFDVVLVADAVYVAALMPALVAAMRSVSGRSSVVLLAYYLRSESADAEFWPRLEAAFEVAEVIPAASFGCDGADKGAGAGAGGGKEGEDGGGGGGEKGKGTKQQRRGLFRLRKRSEEENARLEEERKKRKAEEEDVAVDDGDDDDGKRKLGES